MSQAENKTQRKNDRTDQQISEGNISKSWQKTWCCYTQALVILSGVKII